MDNLRPTHRNTVKSTEDLPVEGSVPAKLQQKGPQPEKVIHAPPVSLSAPHDNPLDKLTLAGKTTAQSYFSQPEEQAQESFWTKAKLAIAGSIAFCACALGGRIINEELNEGSLPTLSQGTKSHLGNVVSILATAKELYGHLSNEKKNSAAYVKETEKADELTNAFEATCERLESIDENIEKREALIGQDAQIKTFKSEANRINLRIKKLSSDIEAHRQAGTPHDKRLIKIKQGQIQALRSEHTQLLTKLNERIKRVDSQLKGTSLRELKKERQEVNTQLEALNEDITELLEKAHQLAQKSASTATMTIAAGAKELSSIAKYATEYSAEHSLTIRAYGDTIQQYLNMYLKGPAFFAGLAVSVYDSYNLKQDYNQRTQTQKKAEQLTESYQDDPELATFLQLVNQKQETSQSYLLWGASIGKVVQNTLSVGIAYGGISIASAATGIDEEVLNSVIPAMTTAIGVATATTCFGLKMYQKYKENSLQKEEDFWIRILQESNSKTPLSDCSEACKSMAESTLQEMEERHGLNNSKLSIEERAKALNIDIHAVISAQATLALMQKNPSFAASIIVARLKSKNARVITSTRDMLLGLGLTQSELSTIEKLSPELAANKIMEHFSLN